MKISSGFTLPELMATIAVVSILTMIAVPSFKNLISNTRVSAGANGFVTALATARSEAIKRGTNVTLCRSANPASDTCTTTSGGWETGWLMRWTDPADNTVKTFGSGNALGNSLTLRGNTNVANSITFSAPGLANGFNGQLTVCDAARTTSPRYITLASTGRATVSKTASNPSTAPTCPP
jgi:type IV fimbrial biogenesis protein FimT